MEAVNMLNYNYVRKYKKTKHSWNLTFKTLQL